MSDTVAIALITAGITGVVGLGGLAFNFWNVRGERALRLKERRVEHKEWYNRTLFEKRLQTAQEAYSWLMKVNTGLNLADPATPDAEWNERLKTFCREAREWYDNNALFLYDSLPQSSKFVGLLNFAGGYAGGSTVLEDRMWEIYENAISEIRARLDQVLATEKVGA